MNDLVKAYHKFYETANADSDFITSLLSYDFSNYHEIMDELSKLQPNLCGKVLKLYTNGTTTGTSRAYSFGPISSIPVLEKVIKTRGNAYRIWINSYSLSHVPDLIDEGNLINDITFNLKFNFDVTNLSALRNTIKQHHEVNLICKPATMLYLSGTQEFIDIVQEFKDRISVISTSDWEPFFKKKPLYPIPLNDNMIDWSSGINFYQCVKGHKHFLPTFVYQNNKVRNLLNLTSVNWKETDDLVNLDKVVSCECGKNRMEFSFVPHYRHQTTNYFEMTKALYAAIEQLIDPYINLQFIDKYDTINILYTLSSKKPISEHDTHYITNALSSVGKTALYHKDKFSVLGTNKIVPFAKGLYKMLDYGYKPKHVRFM